MKLIQRGLFRLCFSTIVLIKIKTRYILKKAVLNLDLQHNFPKIHPFWRCGASLSDRIPDEHIQVRLYLSLAGIAGIGMGLLIAMGIR